MRSWAILTGEYPPAHGTISVHARGIAAALAAAGDRVEVFAPGTREGSAPVDGVTVHDLPDVFGPRSLVALTKALRGRRDTRLFVQYAPRVLGMRAMNLPLCSWLAAQRAPVWTMFHEVTSPSGAGRSAARALHSAVNRAMAIAAGARAERLFVPTPRWEESLRSFWPGDPKTTWLPLPSTAPTRVSDEHVARARETLGLRRGSVHVGHFGSGDPRTTARLVETLVPVVGAREDRVLLLLGKGGVDLARSLRGKLPESRVIAPGYAPIEEIAACLASCAIVVQPYADGVSGRRTSAMAPLALGVPVVTNDGPETESVWRESGGVALGDTDADVVRRAERLLGSASERAELSRRGKELYASTFSIECTARALRGAS